MMRAASLVALFVFMGGAVGGVVTVAVLLGWSLLATPGGFNFDPVWIPQFFIYVPIGALVGIVLGIPAAAATSWVYASSPRTRHATTIAPIGAIFSAVEGAILPSVLGMPSDAAASAAFAGMFAFAGGVAAATCHAYHKHWTE